MIDGEKSGKLRVNVEIFSLAFVRTHVRKRKFVVEGSSLWINSKICNGIVLTCGYIHEILKPQVKSSV